MQRTQQLNDPDRPLGITTVQGRVERFWPIAVDSEAGFKGWAEMCRTVTFEAAEQLARQVESAHRLSWAMAKGEALSKPASVWEALNAESRP